MNAESLEELAVRTLAKVREAIRAADPYNDFGSILGAQDETTEIVEDLYSDLHRASRRARRLLARIAKWEAGEREVGMLRPREAKETEART